MQRIPRPLDRVEIRVLGSLLEKQQTTPEAYPLTLKALTTACNQKTNRDPVLELDESEVLDALERLKQDVLVWRTSGARVDHWEQNLDRRWGLAPADKAVMTLLLLRGPQTPGELRARSDRLHRFESVGEVEETLRALADASDPEVQPLVVELARRPGQKEARWIHTVGAEEVEPALEAGSPIRSSAPVAASAQTTISRRLDRIEERLAALEEAVTALRSGSGLP